MTRGVLKPKTNGSTRKNACVVSVARSVGLSVVKGRAIAIQKRRNSEYPNGSESTSANRPPSVTLSKSKRVFVTSNVMSSCIDKAFIPIKAREPTAPKHNNQTRYAIKMTKNGIDAVIE
jgi:hypothetical protein